MKYFSLVMVFFSTVFTGIALANHNYGIAALNFFCVYLNIGSYNRLKEKETDKKLL